MDQYDKPDYSNRTDALTAADTDGGYALSASDVREALQAGKEAQEREIATLRAIRDEVLGCTAEEIDDTTNTIAGKSEFDRAINGIQEAFDAASQLFAVPSIKVKVEAKQLGKSGEATMQELRLTALADRIRLASMIESARDCALMGGNGYIRTGVVLGQGAASMTGEMRDVGEIYAQDVLPEDVICDPNASSWELQTWRAIRVLMPRRLAMKLYATDEQGQEIPEMAAKVRQLPRYFKDNENQPTESLRRRKVKCEYADVLEMVEVWEFYLFVEGKVRWAVFPASSHIEALGTLRPWEDYAEGFEGGPLVRMTFQNVPGIAPGTSPLEKLTDIHASMRTLGKRIIDGINRAKVVTYGTEDDKALVEQAMAGVDGTHHTRTGGDGQPIQVLQIPYPSKDAYAGLAFLRSEMNNRFINLAQIAGKYGLSDTASEAMILNNNAQRLIASMQERLDNFISRVMSHLNRWMVLIDANGLGPAMESYKYEFGGETLELILDETTREEGELDVVVTASAKRPQVVDPMARAALRTQLLQSGPQIVMAWAQMGIDPALIGDLLAEEHDWPKLGQLLGGIQGEMTEQMLMKVQQRGGMNMSVGISANKTQAPPNSMNVTRPPNPRDVGKAPVNVGGAA